MEPSVIMGGGLPLLVRSHPVRQVVFWVATVLASPLVLLATLLFAFGSDVGDHVTGQDRGRVPRQDRQTDHDPCSEPDQRDAAPG